MALVRKTNDLEKEIKEKISTICRKKMEAVLSSESFQRIIEDLHAFCLRGAHYFPPEISELINKLDDGSLKSLAYCKPPKVHVFKLKANKGVNKWDVGFVARELHSQDLNVRPILLPAGQCLVIANADKTVCVGIEANTVLDYVQISVAIKFPDEKGDVFPPKMGDTGPWQHSIKQFPQCPKFIEGSVNPNEIPPGELQLLIKDLNEVREALLAIHFRFEKTRNYIFKELWQLPSLNKMVEFFPAIKAFVEQKTLDRLNKNARNKKEFNIRLPDRDVVASATEASIK